MARNAVQFQKGLSEAEFDRLYGTEELCRAVVIKLRWPDGFSCPVCGGTAHSIHTARGLFQCTRCRRQTSPTAGTIFAATKLPLRTWFRAIYHMTQSKQGISSIELGRRLGVRQTTAWMLKHKLQQAMMERDGRKRLKGRVEIDDAVLGGQRSGGKRGRGAPGKTPFVAAVETTEDGKPVRLKLRRVAGFTGQAISRFALHSLDPACNVVSDGLACFHRVADAGCAHEAIVTGGGAEAARHPVFRWVNTTLGNIKSAIVGTYRAISSKHAPRYLAEFEYRYNRRYDLASMIPRLGYAVIHAPPMPYRLLKLAEIHG
ncbi:putative transposase for insertion sequence element [Acidiphilium multivorum AIU301]|uniref:Putative transposase for insertion sequence element n=1 Tax=Acidiphilium multivorum (strain DSM 11245 / JCM 8867 / NBRC 100883 / AIU 301) TaxID=926570 RepID=F0IZS8_ACIMA|nr:IS1595 family transposase [Acidiphilium multivorum]BAJ81288.1 putative transposase for insertion sequence element [Acidiphilium multivorum AIU301]GAN73470.1 transposase [Acidiphilium multivorum AIU301]